MISGGTLKAITQRTVNHHPQQQNAKHSVTFNICTAHAHFFTCLLLLCNYICGMKIVMVHHLGVL